MAEFHQGDVLRAIGLMRGGQYVHREKPHRGRMGRSSVKRWGAARPARRWNSACILEGMTLTRPGSKAVGRWFRNIQHNRK